MTSEMLSAPGAAPSTLPQRPPLNTPSAHLASMIEAEDRRRREMMKGDIKEAISDVVHEATKASATEIAESLVSPLAQAQAKAAEEAMRPIKDETTLLRSEARKSSERQKTTLVLIVVAVVLLGAILALLWMGRAAPVSAPPSTPASPASSAPPAEAVSAKKEWQQEIERLQAEATRLAQENQRIQQETTAKTAALENLVANLGAIQQMSTAAREELARLQQLHSAYQFRLLPAEEGRVFVRVKDGASPKQVEGKSYIEVE